MCKQYIPLIHISITTTATTSIDVSKRCTNDVSCIATLYHTHLRTLISVSLLFHAAFVYKYYYFPKNAFNHYWLFPTNFTTVVKYVIITDIRI